MRNEIVILEDNAERRRHMLARLRDRLPPCPVVFFSSAPEMLRYLPNRLSDIRVISLDHDLEREHPSEADPGTGRQVSDYLSRQTAQCPVVIHSTNLFAATAMEADLREAGWPVERVTPYDDLAWIDREWFWAMRHAFLALDEQNDAFPAADLEVKTPPYQDLRASG